MNIFQSLSSVRETKIQLLDNNVGRRREDSHRGHNGEETEGDQADPDQAAIFCNEMKYGKNSRLELIKVLVN